MSMTINSSVGLKAVHQNSNLERSLNNTYEKLASGMRINKAGDDAAGLTISEGMRSQISQFDMEVRNEQDYYSRNQYKDGVMSGVTDYLQRVRTLSVQAANGALTNEDRRLIQIEIDEIKKGIQEDSENSQFNRKNVASEFSLEGLGIADLDLSTQSGANAALKLTDDALDFVSTQRAKTGAKMNRSEHRINSLQNASYNTQAAESQIRDTDYAQQVMNQVRDEVLAKANQSVMTHSISMIQNVANLI